MTDEMVELLMPGDQIIVSAHDGCGGNPWGTIIMVLGVCEEGIHIPNNIVINEPRRVDFYRLVPRPKKAADQDAEA